MTDQPKKVTETTALWQEPGSSLLSELARPSNHVQHTPVERARWNDFHTRYDAYVQQSKQKSLPLIVGIDRSFAARNQPQFACHSSAEQSLTDTIRPLREVLASMAPSACTRKSDIEVFFQSNSQKKPLSLGALSDLFATTRQISSILDTLLQINPDAEPILGRCLVAGAVLFAAGDRVPKNEAIAIQLISSIRDPKEKKNELTRLLVQTCGDGSMIHFTEKLLDLGADPDRCDAIGYTPATIALEADNYEAVELLLHRGASVTKEVERPSQSIWEFLNNPWAHELVDADDRRLYNLAYQKFVKETQKDNGDGSSDELSADQVKRKERAMRNAARKANKNAER